MFYFICCCKILLFSCYVFYLASSLLVRKYLCRENINFNFIDSLYKSVKVTYCEMERGAQSATSWNELKEYYKQRAPVLELQRQALRTDAGAEDVPQLVRGLRYIMLWV